MRPKDIVELLKETFQEWQEDKASKLAAALAYYTAFSIAPLLIIVIAIAAFVLGDSAAQGDIVGQLKHLIGLQGAEAIQSMIQNSRQTGQGIIATIISVVILIFGATGLFSELQDSLNTIWEVAPKPGRGVFGIVKARLLSFAMVLVIGFLMLVSLVLSAGLSGIGNYFGNSIPQLVFVWEALNFVISFAVITLLFATIYRILPDAQIAWNDVWIGSVITSLLFTIGKFLIGLYLGHSSVGSTYGAAGSFVVFLLWVNYSAQILFFGAEFTQVYANKYGSRIRPDKDAIPVTEKARAQQGIPHTSNLKSGAQEPDNQPSKISTATVEPENQPKSVHPVVVVLSFLFSVSRKISHLAGNKSRKRHK